MAPVSPGKRATPPTSGSSNSDTSENSIDSLLEDLHTAESVEQLEQILLHSNAEISANYHIRCLKALLEENNLESVTLASKLLESDKVDWFDHREQLQSTIWELLVKERQFLGDVNKISDQYVSIVRSMDRITKNADMCGKFWLALFQRPSIYYAKCVNVFDQLDYMGNATDKEKLAFLNNLQRMLARASEPIFHDKRCYQPLSKAIVDALELALDEIDDGKKFAAEASRLVQTCVAVPLEIQSQCTPHGACLMQVFRCFKQSVNADYEKAFLDDNLDAIMEWAVLEENGPSVYMRELGEYCREMLMEKVALRYPKKLRPHVDVVMVIFKRHDEAKMVRGLCELYPHATQEILVYFPDIFESLFKTKIVPLFHYELLQKISEQHAGKFEGSHVSRLVARMGQKDEEIEGILKILGNIAENNTLVMKGRGQDYYPIAAGYEECYEENVELANRCLTWIALSSEDEAHRIVKIMVDAYRTMPQLKQASTPVRENLIICWIAIAKVYKRPFKNDRCQMLIDLYAEDLALRDRVRQLKKTISGSTVCTLM